jgi:hypothetical protein
LCQRALYIQSGDIVTCGNVDGVINAYVLATGASLKSAWFRQSEVPQGPYFVHIELELAEQDGPKLWLRSTIGGQHNKPLMLAFDVLGPDGIPLMQALPFPTGKVQLSPGRHTVVECTILLPPLIPGRYSVTCWLGSHYTETCDMVENCVTFDIVNSPTPGRLFPHSPNHGYIVPPSSVLAVEASER